MARPKSERAHREVIEAAAALFAERGIESTSMDAIARASGVSKATIYRHWPDKDTLCLEVLAYLHGLDEEPPVFDSGDFRADLIAQLQHHPAEDRKAMRERIMPHLMAYASHNRVFGDAWRSRVIEPSRTALGNMMERGQQRGILQPDLDREAGLAMLLGPMLYRKIFNRRCPPKAAIAKNDGETSKDLAGYVADGFLAVFGRAEKV